MMQKNTGKTDTDKLDHVPRGRGKNLARHDAHKSATENEFHLFYLYQIMDQK